MDRIINMALRMIMHRLMNKGIDAAMKKAGGTAEDARRARQSARIARRVTRM